MATTPKTLIQGVALGTSAGVLYTAPAGTNTRISQLSLTNTDTSTRIISVYLVSSSSAPTATDTIIKDKTLQVNETWVPYQAIGAVLSAGGTIQATADAAAVVIMKASGLEVT